jgi:hypothetical protein
VLSVSSAIQDRNAKRHTKALKGRDTTAQGIALRNCGMYAANEKAEVSDFRFFVYHGQAFQAKIVVLSANRRGGRLAGKRFLAIFRRTYCLRTFVRLILTFFL